MARALVAALRPSQWVKNLAVVLPVVFARRIDEPETLAVVALAVLAWCAVSSAVYLVNDLADRHEDRRHPEKRTRPVAAGRVGTGLATVSAVVLGAAGLSTAALLEPSLLAVLLVYAAVNGLYSAWLKRVVLLDVMIVASGFVLRVLSGAWVVGVRPSAWLLVCSGLLALFLGFAKRRQELAAGGDDEPPTRAVLARYTLPFLDSVQGLLAAATALAYVIYCVSPETVAHVGDLRLLATAPIVLHGILRYLYLVHVRGAGENPTQVALSDPGIVTTVALWVAVSAAMLYV